MQMFKYYNGEEESPFQSDDLRSKFWWGEMMFSRIDDNEELLRKYEEDLEEWIEWLKEHKPNQAARFLKENTTEQLCVAFYIVLLWGKWNPYDDLSWITEY